MNEKFTSGKHEIVLKRIRDIPSLPEVVGKIIELLSDANTPASRIAELISYDPGLSSKVLRMVNSAAYGFNRQIASIQHGIMILGFNTVRGLVLSASIFKMFEGREQERGLDHRQFWEHSLGTAVAARMLGQAFKMTDVDEAFSAGMLHDIGKVVLDVYFGRDYVEVLMAARKQRIRIHGLAFQNTEYQTLGVSHTEIGLSLAQKWRLPVGITEVIAHHHRPSEAEHCQNLVYLVALANQMATVQYENSGVYSRDFFSDDVLDYFDLNDDELQQFLVLLKEDMESASELFDSIAGGAGNGNTGTNSPRSTRRNA